MKVARTVLKERCPQVIEASTLIKTETGTVVSISFKGANPQLKGIWESAIALIIDLL